MLTKLLTTLCILLALNLSAQTETQSTNEGLSDYYSKKRQMLKKMDDNHFLLLTYEGNNKYLQKFNKNHERLFAIELIETGYYAYIEYLPKSKEIFLIEYEPYTITGSEKLFRIWAAYYHSETGELKSRSELIPSAQSAWTTIFSEDKSHFALWANEDELYGKIFRTSDLQHTGDIIFKPDEEDNFFSRTISNDGTVLLMHQTEENNMRFKFYNRNGELVKTEKLPNPIHDKTDLSDTRIVTASDGLSYEVGLRKQKKKYLGLLSWRIDFDKLTAAPHADLSFDKSTMQKHMYQRVYPSSDKNNPVKMAELQNNSAPGKLKIISIDNAEIDNNGNLVVIMSHEYTKTKTRGQYYVTQYNGDEIYAVSIDPLGQPNWGTVIERWVKYIDSGNPFRPGFSGITSHVHVGENDLSLINFENKALGRNVTVLRQIDLKTGELVKADPLFEEENLVINIKFIDWLNDRHVVCLAKLSASNEISSEVMRLKTVDVIN